MTVIGTIVQKKISGTISKRNVSGAILHKKVTGSIVSSSQSWSAYWATRKPFGLFLVVNSETSITVYWYNWGTQDYDDIRLERKTTGDFSEIATITKGLLLYENTGLTAGTEYTYRLRYRKGGSYSDYTSEVSATTLIDISSLTPDILLRSSDPAGVDLSDFTSWEDVMNNNDFAPPAAANNCTFRNQPQKFVTNKSTTVSALETTLSGANKTTLSNLEFYLVAFPNYEATTANFLMAYRGGAQELLQMSQAADKTALLSFRTNTGVIQNIPNVYHAGRFNIIHVIFNKAGNIVTFEVNGVEAHADYTFGSELIRSTKMQLLNYRGAALGTACALNWCFAEFAAAFSTGLAASRTNIYNALEKKYNTNLGGYSSNVTLGQIEAATPAVTDYLTRQTIYDLVTAGTIDLVEVTTADDPQAKFDAAKPGSLVRFKAGNHIRATNKNRSILYCDKPMYVELEAGAVLKLADNSNTLDHAGELVVNQGTAMVLNDISIRGTYSGTTVQDLCIRIDAEGTPDTFKWGIGTWEPTYSTTGVAITGDWQSLGATGIEIKFNATTGHALDNLWIICFDGEESYGIRVGTGFHTNYIKGVVIFGDGTIDMNNANQIQNSVHAKNLPAGVLIHGRCKDTIIEGITIQNGHRAIIVYGDNDGTYGNNGIVTGGTDYNCINTTIVNCTILNDFSTGVAGYGILLGHPEHRGGSFGMKCNLNTINTYEAGIEPNFRLFNYEIRNNTIRSSHNYSGSYLDIRHWREAINGIVVNNNAIYRTPAAPTGWQVAKNIYQASNARA